ncbi:MAG TPA: glutathione S-transferase family protein [Candidatus Binatia bacterium]|nr:glutathione S-transferase family protein [Candidatus Binatia bacterium]
MKLYYNPRSRAVISKWMLDECGVDYEIVPIDFEKREHKTPEFLKINPAGKLPALVDGDSKIFEGAAICLYLGDKFPEANLAPKIGAPERGRYLSLMVYSTSQLEPAMGDALLGGQTTAPQRGWTDFETARDVIEGELGNGPYLFGEWFTAADVMIGSMFIWKRMFGGAPERPKLNAYVDRLLARPRAPKIGG